MLVNNYAGARTILEDPELYTSLGFDIETWKRLAALLAAEVYLDKKSPNALTAVRRVKYVSSIDREDVAARAIAYAKAKGSNFSLILKPSE